MKLARIKSISYFKAHAADVIRDVAENGPIAITQNGEATGVLVDARGFDRIMETLAMLKLVSLGKEQVRQGRTKPASEVFKRLHRKYGGAG